MKLNSDHKMAKEYSWFETSRNGYYYWLKQKSSKLSLGNTKLLKAIKKCIRKAKAHVELTKSYKMSEKFALQTEKSFPINEKHGIRSMHKPLFNPTTNSNNKLPVAENLTGSKFSCQLAEQGVFSDITFAHTGEEWLYIATCQTLDPQRDNRLVGVSYDDQKLVMCALTNVVNR
jgi:hypothetical protein